MTEAASPQPLSHAERIKLFGMFKYVPAPIKADPEKHVVANAEHIRITDDWISQNIVSIELPWHGRKTRAHRLIADQMLGLWNDWAAAGLLDGVLTFDGAFAPRYKRGQTGSDIHLSNHSWGTAFDINARWNRLGHPPAQFGFQGCVEALIPFCEARGFFWGGHFKTCVDGMHFEAFKVIDAPPPAQDGVA